MTEYSKERRRENYNLLREKIVPRKEVDGIFFTGRRGESCYGFLKGAVIITFHKERILNVKMQVYSEALVGIISEILGLQPIFEYKDIELYAVEWPTHSMPIKKRYKFLKSDYRVSNLRSLKENSVKRVLLESELKDLRKAFFDEHRIKLTARANRDSFLIGRVGGLLYVFNWDGDSADASLSVTVLYEKEKDSAEKLAAFFSGRFFNGIQPNLKYETPFSLSFEWNVQDIEARMSDIRRFYPKTKVVT